MYGLAANLTLILHFVFIIFVVFGGLLFFLKSKIIYFHLPALIWGVYLEFNNLVCPLTHLENWFLQKASQSIYTDGFVQNYIMPIIYPGLLTASLQKYLAIGLIFINIFIYGLFFIKIKKETK